MVKYKSLMALASLALASSTILNVGIVAKAESGSVKSVIVTQKANNGAATIGNELVALSQNLFDVNFERQAKEMLAKFENLDQSSKTNASQATKEAVQQLKAKISQITTFNNSLVTKTKWQAKTKNTSDSTKKWTISLSKDVEDTAENKKRVHVFDPFGEEVAVTVTIKENKITVIPQQGYKEGITYTLVIDQTLKSTKGKALKNAIYMPFAYKNASLVKNEAAFEQAKENYLTAQQQVETVKADYVALQDLEALVNGNKKLQSLAVKTASTEELADFIEQTKAQDLSKLSKAQKEALLEKIKSYKEETASRLQTAVDQYVQYAEEVAKTSKTLALATNDLNKIDEIQWLANDVKNAVEALKATTKDLANIQFATEDLDSLLAEVQSSIKEDELPAPDELEKLKAEATILIQDIPTSIQVGDKLTLQGEKYTVIENGSFNWESKEKFIDIKYVNQLLEKKQALQNALNNNETTFNTISTLINDVKDSLETIENSWNNGDKSRLDEMMYMLKHYYIVSSTTNRQQALQEIQEQAERLISEPTLVYNPDNSYSLEVTSFDIAKNTITVKLKAQNSDFVYKKTINASIYTSENAEAQMKQWNENILSKNSVSWLSDHTIEYVVVDGERYESSENPTAGSAEKKYIYGYNATSFATALQSLKNTTDPAQFEKWVELRERIENMINDFKNNWTNELSKEHSKISGKRVIINENSNKSITTQVREYLQNFVSAGVIVDVKSLDSFGYSGSYINGQTAEVTLQKGNSNLKYTLSTSIDVVTQAQYDEAVKKEKAVLAEQLDRVKVLGNNNIEFDNYPLTVMSNPANGVAPTQYVRSADFQDYQNILNESKNSLTFDQVKSLQSRLDSTYWFMKYYATNKAIATLEQNFKALKDEYIVVDMTNEDRVIEQLTNKVKQIIGNREATITVRKSSSSSAIGQPYYISLNFKEGIVSKSLGVTVEVFDQAEETTPYKAIKKVIQQQIDNITIPECTLTESNQPIYNGTFKFNDAEYEATGNAASLTDKLYIDQHFVYEVDQAIQSTKKLLDADNATYAQLRSAYEDLSAYKYSIKSNLVNKNTIILNQYASTIDKIPLIKVSNNISETQFKENWLTSVNEILSDDVSINITKTSLSDERLYVSYTLKLGNESKNISVKTLLMDVNSYTSTINEFKTAVKNGTATTYTYYNFSGINVKQDNISALNAELQQAFNEDDSLSYAKVLKIIQEVNQ